MWDTRAGADQFPHITPADLSADRVVAADHAVRVYALMSRNRSSTSGAYLSAALNRLQQIKLNRDPHNVIPKSLDYLGERSEPLKAAGGGPTSQEVVVARTIVDRIRQRS